MRPLHIHTIHMHYHTPESKDFNSPFGPWMHVPLFDTVLKSVKDQLPLSYLLPWVLVNINQRIQSREREKVEEYNYTSLETPLYVSYNQFHVEAEHLHQTE